MIICDRCDKKLARDVAIAVALRDVSGEHEVGGVAEPIGDSDLEYDLCPECAKDAEVALAEWVNGADE